MRKTCIDCVEKHLGSAAVYVEETQLGYPNYRGFVIGELVHASSECLESNPGLAWLIREHRIQWQGNPKHRIPFEGLFFYLDIWKGAEFINSNAKPPEIPKELYEGIPDGPDGAPQMSMDTRP